MAGDTGFSIAMVNRGGAGWSLEVSAKKKKKTPRRESSRVNINHWKHWRKILPEGNVESLKKSCPKITPNGIDCIQLSRSGAF